MRIKSLRFKFYIYVCIYTEKGILVIIDKMGTRDDELLAQQLTCLLRYVDESSLGGRIINKKYSKES